MMNKRFEKFTNLITKLNRQINKIKIMEMKPYGLKADHATCLFYLYYNDGLSQAEIAKLSEIDRASVNRDVEKLKEKNLISIEQEDKTKKYNAKIFLTNKGKDIAEKTIERINNAVNNGGKSLNEEERKNFYFMMDSICHNLDEYIEGGLK